MPENLGPDNEPLKFRLKLYRNQTIENLHKKKITDMKADLARNVLYSVGKDQRINVYDLD